MNKKITKSSQSSKIFKLILILMAVAIILYPILSIYNIKRSVEKFCDNASEIADYQKLKKEANDLDLHYFENKTFIPLDKNIKEVSDDMNIKDLKPVTEVFALGNIMYGEGWTCKIIFDENNKFIRKERSYEND